MNYQEYSALAIRTAKLFNSSTEDLNHAALGISSEAGELCLTVAAAWMRMPFQPDNIVEELGDCAWFSNLAACVMGYKLEELVLEPAEASDMSPELAGAVMGRNPVALTLMLNYFAAEFASTIKAYVVYGKPLDTNLATRQLKLVFTTIILLSDIHGINFEETTMPANIDKLAKRYPEKYSDQAAIKRADKKDPPSLVIVH